MLQLYLVLLLLNLDVMNTFDMNRRTLSMLPLLDTNNQQEIHRPQTRRKYLEQTTTTTTTSTTGTNKYKKQTHFNEDFTSDNINDRWLFMVDSGKFEEEQENKKITPKSVFIAPLITNRAACKEGYRFDHQGKCVKVIKLDPSAQLDFLLKKLNEMYSKTNLGVEEEAVKPSSGPLQISFPLTQDKEVEEVKIKEQNEELPNTTSVVESKVNYTVSVELNKNKDEDIDIEVTTELDISEYSGSGDTTIENFTESIGSLEEQYMLVNVTETTTQAPETTTELPTTTEECEMETSTTEISRTTEYVVETTRVDDIVVEKQNISLIKFPDEKDGTNFRFGNNNNDKYVIPSLKFNVGTHAEFGKDDRVKLDVTKEQFWWLPEGWKYDDIKQNPTLLNFWSKLPLVKDVSFVDVSENTNRNPELYQYGVAPSDGHRLQQSQRPHTSRNPNWQFPSNRFSQQHTDVFKPSKPIVFESFSRSNPWVARTDHERQTKDYRPPVYYRSSISS